MNILWNGFAGLNHSWSIVAQNICREFIKLGHTVDIFSTNGDVHFPDDLRKNLIGFTQENTPEKIYGKLPNATYDMQMSYTALKNFSHYFLRGNSNRFGIWNFETTVLPVGFAKHYRGVDKVLPSSKFSKQVFIDNGIPDQNQVVVPHGIHLDRFENLGKYPLKTNKKYKFLANIAQPHLRKNIPGLLETWGKAFTKSDDVCLVLKISKKSPQQNSANVSFNDIFASFKSKFKNHADIEIIDTFITDIEPLYNACDVVLTMSHAECFWMPGLEGLAAKKIVVAPRYGGQLDFMNDDNSFLVDGKEVRADQRLQYWTNSMHAKVFEPNTDHAAKILKDISLNYNDLYNKFIPNINNMIGNYSWNNVAKQIIKLCK